MADFAELMNICNYCAYAPCVCGNEPENCADYVRRHGLNFNAEEHKKKVSEGVKHSYGERREDNG